jgi:hypothetical protein
VSGPKIANQKPKIENGLPLIPLAAWAAALVGYHAIFLVQAASFRAAVGPEAAARAPSFLALTLTALPDIFAQGILHLPVALLSLALWAVALGAGMAILRRAGYEELTTGERAVFGGGIGMGVLSLGTLLLGVIGGRPHWLLEASLVVLLLVLAAVGVRELLRAMGDSARALRAWGREATRLHILVVVLGVAVVLLALTRANVPVFNDYDSLEYHLGAPARWWREGRVSFLRGVVYTNFPLNVEMLYLLAMSCFGGPIRGAVVGLQVGIGFVVLTAGAIAACGRRLGAPAAGRAGAAIFLATPMLAGLATQSSYVVELPMTAYAFLALYGFLLLRAVPDDARRSRRRLAILCGVMAGLAVGCKYPAVLFVLVPVLAFILVGGILRRGALRRRVGEAAAVGLVAMAVASPWLVRNAVNTGNPTYPLLHGIFGGANWSAEQDAKFAKAHRAGPGSLPDAGRRFWAFAAWRDQPGGEWRPPWRPPAAPLLFLFAIIPFALSGRYTARPVLYVALLFVVSAALLRFGSGGSGALSGVPSVATAAGILALVASPLLFWRRRELLFCHAFFVLWSSPCLRASAWWPSRGAGRAARPNGLWPAAWPTPPPPHCSSTPTPLAPASPSHPRASSAAPSRAPRTPTPPSRPSTSSTRAPSSSSSARPARSTVAAARSPPRSSTASPLTASWTAASAVSRHAAPATASAGSASPTSTSTGRRSSAWATATPTASGAAPATASRST